MHHLTQAVAFEMAPHNIAVNALLPSEPVLTPGNLVAYQGDDFASVDDFAEATLQRRARRPDRDDRTDPLERGRAASRAGHPRLAPRLSTRLNHDGVPDSSDLQPRCMASPSRRSTHQTTKEGTMHVNRNDIPAKIDASGRGGAPGDRFRRHSGVGTLGGEFFTLAAGTDIARSWTSADGRR